MCFWAEIFGVALVDDGSDEGGEVVVEAVGALEGGAEPRRQGARHLAAMAR